MKKTLYDCPKCVGEQQTIKHGKRKKGSQRYLYKECGHTFLESYSYKGCMPEIEDRLKAYLKEGVRIRSAGRLLGISKETVQRKLLKIVSGINKPLIQQGRIYKLDEMCTWIGSKSKYYE